MPREAALPRRVRSTGQADHLTPASRTYLSFLASAQSPAPACVMRGRRTGYKAQMLREGPIPVAVHGLIEYVAGVAFVVAPFLLDYDSDAAKAFSIIVGIAILVIAASTDGPTSLVNQIPVPAHVVLDYVLAVGLVALPFVAGFASETAPTAFFIALGVAHLLITIGTRFREAAAR